MGETVSQGKSAPTSYPRPAGSPENTLISNSLQRQRVVSICLGMDVFTFNYVITITKEKRPQI